MALKRLAAAASASVILASGAYAQTVANGTAANGTSAPAAAPKSWPIVLSVANTKRTATPAQWSREEIEAAQARCAVLLNGLDVVAVPETPVRESGRCGTPAPMKLVSIGTGAQQVLFSPAPLVTCDLIAGLAKWLQQDVQPLARRHLGAPVTRIETMSSYSCRNAYGRADSRLSEHGRANALDIAGFVTEKAQLVSVEGDWGMTAREIAAQQKRQDAAPPHHVAETHPEPAPASTPRAAAAGIKPVTPTPSPAQDTAAALPNLPGISLHFSGPAQPTMGFDQPSRLGGPKTRNAPVAVIPPPPPPPRSGAPTVSSRAEFLRSAHKVACRTFGTVLGPEANKTHRNHFHLDMAERIQNTKICE